MADDDPRDGNYPGMYRYSEGYTVWMQMRAFIAETLKIEPQKIWYFYLAGHIGDQVSALTAIGAFKKRRGNPPVAAITDGPPDLATLFSHCVDMFCKPAQSDFLAPVMPLQRFAPGYPIIVEPHFFGDGRLLDLFPACTFNDLVRFILRLPMGTPLVPPIVPAAAREQADRVFAAYGLPPGRTVLLAPFSNSAPRMPVRWWAEAADFMKKRGLIPVTNVPNHYGAVKREDAIPGTIGVDVLLLQVIPFLERAGHFLASVQGLCDLVSFASAKLKIIYTPAHFVDGIRPEDGGSPTGGYSLVRNYAPTFCDQLELTPDMPFDPAVLQGWVD